MQSWAAQNNLIQCHSRALVNGSSIPKPLHSADDQPMLVLRQYPERSQPFLEAKHLLPGCRTNANPPVHPHIDECLPKLNRNRIFVLEDKCRVN